MRFSAQQIWSRLVLMTNSLSGFGYFFRGMGLLKQPGLRRFVIIPLLANVAVFALMASAIYQAMSRLYIEYSSNIVGDWEFISWIVAPLIWLFGALLSGYISIFIVLFLTSPFHSLLAERVEEHVTGERIVNDSSALQTVLAIPRGFIREIQKIMHYIPMALLVLIISFIPAVNIVAPLLWILLGAWMMSLQFVDYPMDNHRLPFSEVRDACSARRSASITFGVVVAFVSGLPILNLILIPAAVAGATLLWCEELRHLR
jgi:CysZ protein